MLNFKNNSVEEALPLLPVLFVLDTSGSMEGEPVQILNQAVHETLRDLQDLVRSEKDVNIKVGLMEFNTSPVWKSQNLETIETAMKHPPFKSGGITNLGSALKDLNDKLSNPFFLTNTEKIYRPVIVFMTDGIPTESYDVPLKQICHNPWFKKAIKIGIGLGEAPDLQILSEITDNGAVIRAHELEEFKSFFRKLTVNSSRASKDDHLSDLSEREIARRILAQSQNQDNES